MQENDIGPSEAVMSPEDEWLSSQAQDPFIVDTERTSLWEDAVIRLSTLYALWRGY